MFVHYNLWFRGAPSKPQDSYPVVAGSQFRPLRFLRPAPKVRIMAEFELCCVPMREPRNVIHGLDRLVSENLVAKRS